MDTRLLIGGELRAGLTGRRWTVEDPAHEQAIAEVGSALTRSNLTLR